MIEWILMVYIQLPHEKQWIYLKSHRGFTDYTQCSKKLGWAIDLAVDAYDSMPRPRKFAAYCEKMITEKN